MWALLYFRISIQKSCLGPQGWIICYQWFGQLVVHALSPPGFWWLFLLPALAVKAEQNCTCMRVHTPMFLEETEGGCWWYGVLYSHHGKADDQFGWVYITISTSSCTLYVELAIHCHTYLVYAGAFIRWIHFVFCKPEIHQEELTLQQRTPKE